MAEGNQRWSVPTHRFGASIVIGVVGVFVVCGSAGMGNATVGAIGLALIAGAIGLYVISAVNGRTFSYVLGSGHVVSASEPPSSSSRGRCNLQILVTARNYNGVAVKIRDPRVPVAKWPDAGSDLPILVAVGDPRRVRVLWDEVKAHGSPALRRARGGAGPDLADDLEGFETVDLDSVAALDLDTEIVDASDLDVVEVVEADVDLAEPDLGNAVDAAFLETDLSGVDPGDVAVGDTGIDYPDRVVLIDPELDDVDPIESEPNEPVEPDVRASDLDPPDLDEFGLNASHLDEPGLDASHLDESGLETSHLDPSHLDPSGLDTSGLGTSHLDESGLEASRLDEAGFDASGVGASHLDEPGSDAAGLDESSLGEPMAASQDAEREDEPAIDFAAVMAEDFGGPADPAADPARAELLDDDGDGYEPVVLSVTETGGRRTIELDVLDPNNIRWSPAPPGAASTSTAAEAAVAAAASVPLPRRTPSPRPRMAADMPAPPPTIDEPEVVAVSFEDIATETVPLQFNQARVVTPAVTADPDTSPDELVDPSTPISDAYLAATPPPGTSTGPGRVRSVAVTLFVRDLSRSIIFYRDFLGFTESDAGRGSAVLISGDARIVLRRVAMAPVDRRLVQLLLEVPDVDAAYADLRSRGVEFLHRPRPVGQYEQMTLWAAAFRDPDGHGIAVTQWRLV